MSDPRRQDEQKLASRIRAAMPPLDARLRRRAVRELAAQTVAEIADDGASTPALIAALLRLADAAVGEVERLERQAAALLLAYQSALGSNERREVVLDYLRSEARGTLDAATVDAATRRWLDIEAVDERIAAKIADRLDQIQAAHDLLCHCARRDKPDYELAVTFRNASGVAVALRHAEPARRASIRNGGLRLLLAMAQNVPHSERLAFLGVADVRKLMAWARGVDASRWTRIAALELCAHALPPREARQLLAEQIAERMPGDGLILRRNALRILGDVAPRKALTIALRARSDPSDHVRQELARLLRRIPLPRAVVELAALACEDASAPVAGVALRELTARAMADGDARGSVVHAITLAIRCTDRPPMVRVALESIEKLACRAMPIVPARSFVRCLEELVNLDGAPADLVDAAAGTLRRLEVATHPTTVDLAQRFREAMRALREGEAQPVDVPSSASSREIERALAVAARGDMTVSLRELGPGRFLITRGEPRRWRFWRALHELKTPMPDKRKGFVHSRARVPTGEIVVPPIGMAEVTPTRVPGERHLSPAVGGWGAFLPRVDDLLAVATVRSRPLRLVLAIGSVTLEGPPRLTQRLWARAYLSIHYASLAQARERSLAAAESSGRRAYAEAARKLGFRMSIGDTDGEVEGERFALEPRLPAHYYAGLAIVPTWLESFVSFILSSKGNTPWHLAIAAWLVFTGFVLRIALIKRGIVKAREQIPLTIGGWGTRGKSGTERLKAALFHALRYDVVVKTTGCEAMFIHAQRDRPAQEIFVYRPYDKATIWEQRDLLYVATQLRAQVFLWECMALQPRFVETLASEWMQDDITTLTNAYPDHEDIQGPGGEDVARVIARFMSAGRDTFTTEEQMLPLLQDAADKQQTRLVAVAPIEADLLAPDLLARLPYQEHPCNVALVLALAEHLGIDREFALVEIADHVIMDLGVLKTYPTVEHRGRRLTFSNGMSANERAGFLSNWTRLGFDKNDVDAEPQLCTVVVVNNRADRVARSRVFAQILVDDAAVDHIVLINSNLGGMMRFISEALDAKLREMVVTGEGGVARGLLRFDTFMSWVKVPSYEGALSDKMSRMLGALLASETSRAALLEDAALKAAVDSAEPGSIGAALEVALKDVPLSAWGEDRRPDVVRHAKRMAARITRSARARDALKAAFERGDDAAANQAFRGAFRELFLDRIAVVWNADATGDQIIDAIAREVPPGLEARVMGVQNIKGAGLDFVYRWLSIERVRQGLDSLSAEPGARAKTLAWMMSYQDLGIVDAREALTKLRTIQEAGEPGWAQHDGLVKSAIAKLTQIEKEKAARLEGSGKAGLFTRFLGQVEQLVDHLDSVRRGNRARRVMTDLFAARIGHGRAAILLREVTGRQKGGWLARDLAAWLEGWRPRKR